MNTLIDLIINLSNNLQRESSDNSKLLNSLLKDINNYIQNLDYIKTQVEYIIKELVRTKNKNTIQNTSLEVDQLTEAIKNLNINNIKKPTPYTHWQPRK